MAIIGRELQVIDTSDVYYIVNGKTMFSGSTSKADIDQKVKNIEITSGIGEQRKAILRSNKNVSTKITINSFDLNFLAAANGVTLNTTATNSYYFGQPTPVTTNSATVTGATRVLSVRKVDGTFLTIVTGTPADATQVKASGTTLTFYTGFADTQVYVSYIGAKPTGKDNVTITFNAKSFPSAGELILKTIGYDTQTEAIVCDVVNHFYSAVIDPNFSMTFEVSKPLSTDVNMDFLVPNTLPDGTLNTNGDIGMMTVTER